MYSFGYKYGGSIKQSSDIMHKEHRGGEGGGGLGYTSIYFILT